MIFIKLLRILWPAILLIFLIPVVENDFVLTGIYIAVGVLYMMTHPMRNDWFIYVFGVFAMTFFESIFIFTGVETFNRQTLLGIMPLWLPFLWAFAFVLARRALKILDHFDV